MQNHGLLVNTLAANEKYHILNRDNLMIPIQMQLSQKEKTFSRFFAAFLKSRLSFKHFEKKMPVIILYFRCYRHRKRSPKMSKKSRFRGNFEKQHEKGAQALFKCASHHLYQIHWSLPSQWSWKKSLFLTWKSLGLFVNTLATDEMHPVLNRDNFTIPIQMQLSQKEKIFSQFFASSMKSRWKRWPS